MTCNKAVCKAEGMDGCVKEHPTKVKCPHKTAKKTYVSSAMPQEKPFWKGSMRKKKYGQRLTHRLSTGGV